MRSICGQQLFCSLRAHQSSSDQMEILKNQSVQTTTRARGSKVQKRHGDSDFSYGELFA